ncbi:uncharacterized protein [Diadema antillarum]|uniref:uncharacterized protein n=1 Tax=Diadema antillarum TaxID=105358 RepID=UPI003A8A8681
MPGERNVKYRQWSEEDMENAFHEVRDNHVPISVAARDHGVPRRSLGDRVNGKVPLNAKLGAMTKLSTELERDLLTVINYMAAKAMPLTVNQILMYAWVLDRKCGDSKFGEKGPSYNWWLRFRKAYPDMTLKLRRPDRLDRSRIVSSTVDNLREYFQLLKGVLDRYNLHDHPDRIYNVDETMIDLNKSTQKVVVPAYQRHAHAATVADSQHISLLCCVSAAGAVMPPNLIFKKGMPGGNYSVGGPDNALYSKSSSGFVDGELMLKWFKKVFLKYCSQDRSEKNPVLLLQDGHASHLDPLLILEAIQENVILLQLVPHTTHLCQPLDVSVFKSLKSHIGRYIKEGQAIRGSLWVSKTEIPRVLKTPFEKAMTIHNIKQGFRKCGIHPFDPNAIDKHQLVRSRMIPSTDIDLALPPQYRYADAATQTSIQPPNEQDAALPDRTNAVTAQDQQTAEVHEAPQTEEMPEAEDAVTPDRPSTSYSKALMDNPLVRYGVVSPEVAEVFLPQLEWIPSGRKRAPRGKSKARVLTAKEAKEDYEREVERIKEKQRMRAERQKKKKERGKLKKNQETRPIEVNVNSEKEWIPPGRKWAPRGKSKACVLTAKEAKEDFEREVERIKEKQRKKAERQKKKKERGKLKKNQEKRPIEVNVNSEKDGEEVEDEEEVEDDEEDEAEEMDYFCNVHSGKRMKRHTTAEDLNVPIKIQVKTLRNNFNFYFF